MPAIFEALPPHHDRAAFSCGNPAIDAYLRNLARQDEKRNLARVFVMAEPGDDRILGFYSLTNTRIPVGDLPEKYGKRLPKGRVIPGALIGQLARALEHRGKGVGELLLIDALRRIVRANEISAVHAVIVDAIDDDAADFYENFGFLRFAETKDRLFLPMATVLKLGL